MTRTHRNNRSTISGSGHAGGKNMGSASQRRSQISRTLSKLLRHQAENERIPITRDGWVKVTDLLAWRGLSDPGRIGPAANLDEIIDVVRDDGLHGKGRFALRLLDEDDARAPGTVSIGVDGAATGALVEDTPNTEAANKDEIQSLAADVAATSLNVNLPTSEQTPEDSKNSPETLHAITCYEENPKTPASAFLIRATQGHSIKAVESEGLLTPITLDDPTSIPDTVVHGTFYGAWNRILASGGLKSMSRNMVHFASGPSIEEVLPQSESTNTNTTSATTATSDAVATTSAHQPRDSTQNVATLQCRKDVEDMLSRNKVISGMRWDAQVLIYIDLKRLLQDARQNEWDMKWWRSDNGVILSEGVTIPVPSTSTSTGAIEKDEDDDDENDETVIEIQEKQQKQQRRHKGNPNKTRHGNKKTNERSEEEKLVPSSYFKCAVEIKAGLGVLFDSQRGGIVQELPRHLSEKALPRGKR